MFCTLTFVSKMTACMRGRYVSIVSMCVYMHECQLWVAPCVRISHRVV